MKPPSPHRPKPMKPPAPMAGKAGGLIQGPVSSALGAHKPAAVTPIKTDRGAFKIKG